jgi:hypothetical protein
MTGFTITKKIHFGHGRAGRKVMKPGKPESAEPIGRVPRLSRLMALAIHMDALLRQGIVADHADLAVLAHVSRARITQMMNLLLLAPDIQEEILFLPRNLGGRDSIAEPSVRHVTAIVDWVKQRKAWEVVRRKVLG